MRGSLAVWCEASPSASPELVLHFNLWRDLPGSPDVLDVGFQFQHAHSFAKLHFFIPAKVVLEDISDLSEVLEDDFTLSAVFNETLTVGAKDASSFHRCRGPNLLFGLHELHSTIMFRCKNSSIQKAAAP